MAQSVVVTTTLRPDKVAGDLTADDLDRFRGVQRLAYDCAETIAATLEPGTTERETAAAMHGWLVERGVDDWFHTPFAWFGDRAMFKGFRLPTQFFPSDRKLADGMGFILDCAPIVDGYTADIGYTASLGDNAVVDRLMADLAPHRELILDGVRAGRTLRDVYGDVDRLLDRQGLSNRHRKYPGAVLAHRVGIVRGRGPRPVVARFGTRSLRALGRMMRDGRRAGWSPLWGPTRASDHPATPGLWAVEPHVGFRGVGAKFEELLVVTNDGDAFWLDDEVPHVRRWQS
jgi:Xaa-Pro aminopeptidase